MREHTYDRIKAECGPAAQAAQHVIKKVADAYRFPARRLAWNVSPPLGPRRAHDSPEQLNTLAACRKGESDLVHRDGGWYLYATCEVPDVPMTEPDGFLGVDLGIANIATTADGTRHSGKGLNALRHRLTHGNLTNIEIFRRYI
ncbi:hypothetical protein ABGB18_10720 [Nonomuraea sp. B12E4]|uniref:hypothetical protein n=1 Tax=Nonomuraea sp. B12E4 TaxID=3153564 RepID=UPI00325CC90B